MAKLSMNSTYKLKTGYEIPVLGLGTAGDAADWYKIDSAASLDANIHALQVGYRHMDSASMYGSQQSCGEAVRKSGVNREAVFVTSKCHKEGYEGTKAAIDAGLKESGLGYFDLYLIHSPYGGPEIRKGAWRAMVEAQRDGKIRSLGVSNYGVHHLEETMEYTKELEAEFGEGNGGQISVGQWELHPWLTRPDIVNWCHENGVVVEAYCPLVRTQRFDEPVLQPLIQKYGKTAAQVLIRWSLQKGFVPLPKSLKHSRIESNADVFDFELTDEEMASLETGEYSPCTWDPTVSPLDN
ncbi:NADP-dependent oxidoreductase domain-containing protein [Xylogone sp. PMI_703]|nr:NADP-dependent oxidoreductase domain-containing protein [Xylogone sp. PMI_703]